MIVSVTALLLSSGASCYHSITLSIPIQFTGRGLRVRAGREGLRAEPQVDGVRGLRHRDRPHLRPAGVHGRIPSGEALGGNFKL